MKKANDEIVSLLNEALVEEYGQYVEMATQAAITQGPESLYLKSFFENQAQGALRHAGLLRERIYFLGGIPETKVGKSEVFTDSREAIAAGLEQHVRLVEKYRSILGAVQRHQRKDGDVLYETVEEILEDEQADLEAFQRLRGVALDS